MNSKEFCQHNYNENYDYIPQFVDIDGKPVRKTKYEYPYSYDEYLIWNGNYSKTDSAVYSDRMMQWDFRKFTELSKKVFGNEGQLFHKRNPKDIERFLSMYFEKSIKLTAIIAGCNVSNGYPYWIFFYREKI